VILVIMSVQTFKTYIIVFICKVIMCLISHWLVIFRIGHFIDTDNITRCDQRKNVQITDNTI
jgi:hypothetical protein